MSLQPETRDLVGEVDTPVKSSRVMYAGLETWTPVEGEVFTELGLRRSGSDALANSSAPVLEWLASEGITHLAVHFDVLDPKKFGPLWFRRPQLDRALWF